MPVFPLKLYLIVSLLGSLTLEKFYTLFIDFVN